ncbi:MAG TPA: DUF4124 domain-containing protein [Steroidobacteraceae bacterium]|nr:DUF4124 domain-containing protein [Steroidobacteraceae bacterium]
MRRILFTLMLLAGPAALAATTVYKWVDDSGEVHYSDQPHPNAQKLEISGVQTYRAQTTGANAAAAPRPPQSSAPASAYQGCAIAQPASEQTLENADSVAVSVRTDPAPRPGDQIFLLLDGRAVNGGSPTGTHFSISPVERGQHTLTAQVRDGDGQVLCQSPSITFYVHQPSILNPANPVRPH